MEIIVSECRYFADGGATAAREHLETLPEAREALARGETWQQDQGGTWKLRVGEQFWLCAADVD